MDGSAPRGRAVIASSSAIAITDIALAGVHAACACGAALGGAHTPDRQLVRVNLRRPGCRIGRSASVRVQRARLLVSVRAARTRGRARIRVGDLRRGKGCFYLFVSTPSPVGALEQAVAVEARHARITGDQRGFHSGSPLEERILALRVVHAAVRRPMPQCTACAAAQRATFPRENASKQSWLRKTRSAEPQAVSRKSNKLSASNKLLRGRSLGSRRT